MLKPRGSILLVDDHPENLLALESVLEDLSYDLVRANSGKEALRRLLEAEFAVIILDVQMPDMDGFETAARIRQRKKNQHTPIIFLTAYSKSESHVSRGYLVGAIDYLFKPFDPVLLKAKVAAFVELDRMTRELRDQISRREKAEGEVRKLNQDLELRVAKRTTELEDANRRLAKEVNQRRRAEEEARRSQRNVEGLNVRLQRAMQETHHRGKNNLQVISALVDTQILRSGDQVPVSELRRLTNHVRALANIHDLLT